MASSLSISLALGLALTVGAVATASAARVNGGPSGPSGPSSNPNPTHDGIQLPSPQNCKTWHYIVVDGVQKRECKVYDTQN